jgi:hypothetical protein
MSFPDEYIWGFPFDLKALSFKRALVVKRRPSTRDATVRTPPTIAHVLWKLEK